MRNDSAPSTSTPRDSTRRRSPRQRPKGVKGECRRAVSRSGSFGVEVRTYDADSYKKR